MKVVILAGGYGTRISEETGIKPKPMVEIGDMPILWHIMKIYSFHGLNDFVICLGYKGHVIKEYFANYILNKSNVTFDFKKNKTTFHHNNAEPWTVTLVDTGESSMTGGRIRRVKDHIGDDTFCMTYGDGVTDLNIQELIQFHKSHEAFATLTAVQPPGRFGAFTLSQNNCDKITSQSQTQYDRTCYIETFQEKPKGDRAWINGGFFVLEPEVMNFIEGDATVWEKEPLEALAQNGKLIAFRHPGFWQAMDTLRDKMYLQKLYDSGQAPWIKW
jgi:glucose-1-phosphate cytidylyltransferase